MGGGGLERCLVLFKCKRNSPSCLNEQECFPKERGRNQVFEINLFSLVIYLNQLFLID